MKTPLTKDAFQVATDLYYVEVNKTMMMPVEIFLRG